MSSAALVGRFFDAALSGDVVTLKALVSPDCVVHEPADLPYGGEYVGVDGLLTMFGALNRDFEFSIAGEPLLLEAGEGRVVVRIPGRFVSRASGRTAEFPIAEIYTLSGGQIVDVDVYYKEPAAVRALLDPS